MNNDHYDTAKTGDWTYSDGTTHQTFIFRKGSSSDPIVNPLHAQRTCPEDGRKDWICRASGWGRTNPLMIDALCNLMNREGFR